jgi:hypothetical protein
VKGGDGGSMTTAWKLSVVAAAVALSTGCIEFDSKLALNNDGSGGFSTHIFIGPTLVRMMDAIGGASPAFGSLMSDGAPKKPNGAARKQLAAAGITDVVVSAKQSKKGWTWDEAASFTSPSALAAMGETVGGAVPAATIFALEDGTYVLEWTPGKQGDEEPKPTTPEMSPDAIQKVMSEMGDIGDMFAEMATFRMGVRADVPGEILSFDPAWGKAEGGGVAWSISATEIMAMGGGGGGPELPDAFRVRFRTVNPLPAEIVSPGGMIDLTNLI